MSFAAGNCATHFLGPEDKGVDKIAKAPFSGNSVWLGDIGAKHANQ